MLSTTLPTILVRLWYFIRRRHSDEQLDVELRHHLESLEAEHRARGLSPEEARRRAHRDIGGLAQIREAYRDQRGLPMLQGLWRDVRFSVRSIRRSPSITVAVVLTLAIGIGANTVIFSVVNSVLLQPLPYPDADRLVAVSHTAPGVNVANVASAPFLYFIEREQSRTFEGVGLLGQGTSTVTGRTEPAEVRRLFVTSDIPDIIGIGPALGRYFSEADDSPGAPNAVVLTYGYWQREFGGDGGVLGQSLILDGEPWEIIGVAGQAFGIPNQQPDVITPFRIDRSQVTLGGYFRQSIARLRPGVTLEEANADVARLIPIAIASFPPGPGSSREQIENSQLGPALRPLKDAVVGIAGNVLWVVMGTVAILLLIACANVANLILVRTEGRRRELSTRAALGAGWGRIARELLTESLIFGVAGGMLGIGLSYAGLRVLLAITPADLPRMEEIAIDSTVLLFALAVSLASGLLFGLLPAIRYARGRATTLWPGGHWSTGGREKLRLSGALVTVQVGLALILLIGAGLMIRTFRELGVIDAGFTRPEQVQTVRLTIPEASVPDPELTARRQNEILDRLASLPDVEGAALMSDVPMGGGSSADLLVPEGRAFSEGESPRSVQTRFISPGAFSTLGMPLVLGRDLTWTDIYEERPVVLISQNLARLEWGSPEEALGQRLRGSSSEDQLREIIGIVGDAHDRGLSQPVTETVYYPVYGERVYNNPVYVFRSSAFVIRSSRAGTPALLNEIRQAVWSVDPDLPLTSVRTMADLLGASLSPVSFTLVMLAVAGGMALLLGLVGLYGVVSYGVSRRKREVGIRVALGARRGQIQAMFLRQGLALTVLGLIAGLGGAVAVTRLMASLLFGVSPVDPLTYVGVSVALLLAASIATYLPARRATHLDPAETLRAD